MDTRLAREVILVIIKGQRSFSFGFFESNDVGVLPEAFPAEQEVVFADKAHLAGAASALSAVLSVFSSVGSPEQVWHLWLIK